MGARKGHCDYGFKRIQRMNIIVGVMGARKGHCDTKLSMNKKMKYL